MLIVITSKWYFRLHSTVSAPIASLLADLANAVMKDDWFGTWYNLEEELGLGCSECAVPLHPSEFTFHIGGTGIFMCVECALAQYLPSREIPPILFAEEVI